MSRLTFEIEVEVDEERVRSNHLPPPMLWSPIEMMKALRFGIVDVRQIKRRSKEKR